MKTLDEFTKEVEQRLEHKIPAEKHGLVTAMFVRKATVGEVVNALILTPRERLGGDGLEIG